MILYIILFLIILVIIIWGGVTQWRFIKGKDKERYDKEFIPFKIKLKKFMKSLDSDKYVKYVDKVLFKDYAKSKGIETVKTVLGPFDDSNEIKLKDIPDNCVIKLNNGYARNIGIKNNRIIFGPFKGELINKVFDKVKKKLNEWRGSFGGELQPQYTYIKPKIFIEELLDPIPPDYKFWVFNGKVKAMHIAQNNKIGVEQCHLYYDRNGRKINCKCNNYPECDNSYKLPKNFNNMVKVAEILADDLKFARIDLYNDNEKILGGEVTLSPIAGNVKFYPESYDKMFSNFWE